MFFFFFKRKKKKVSRATRKSWILGDNAQKKDLAKTFEDFFFMQPFQNNLL